MTALLVGLAVSAAVLLGWRAPVERPGPSPQPASEPPPGRAGRVRPTGRPGAGPAWRPSLAAAATVTAVLVLVGGVPGAVLAVGAGAAVARAVARLEPESARRRRERLTADLPHAVDLLAACLAAGHAPGPVVAQVAAAVGGPLGEELSLVAARVGLGADPAGVWRGLGRHPQVGPLGRTVARALDGGASVAQALDRLADDLRREARARTEARARAVGVKAAVPLGACLLPAFLLTGVVPLVVGSLSAALSR